MTANTPLGGREGASGVVRDDIENAARLGYLSALENKPPGADYERATDRWQRNYETGRLWVVIFRGAGLSAPPWPEKRPRPDGFADILARLPHKLDSMIPRPETHLPPDPALDLPPQPFRSAKPLRRRRMPAKRA